MISATLWLSFCPVFLFLWLLSVVANSSQNYLFHMDITFIAEVSSMKFFRLDNSKVLSWLCCKVVFSCSYFCLLSVLRQYFLVLFVTVQKQWLNLTCRLQLGDACCTGLHNREIFFSDKLKCFSCFIFHLIFFKGYKWPLNTALRFLVCWIIFNPKPFVRVLWLCGLWMSSFF